MRCIAVALGLLFGLTPVHAIVGGAATDTSTTGRSVVTIVGSRGNFCSGAVIAADLVLTAAHCVPSTASYKIVIPGESPPRLIDVKRVSIHPQFNAAAIANSRASADVAVLQTAEPLTRMRSIAATAAPLAPLQAGQSFTVTGVGVTSAGDGKSGGTVRSASLIATGKPGTLQIRLVDDKTNNASAGLGACTGDSGAPVFQEQQGRSVIIGVVSWSTAPNNAAGCGGLTGVTPLTLYRAWVVEVTNK